MSFVGDENGLPSYREEHGIGFPMPRLQPACDVFIAFVNRWAVSVAGPAALVLQPRLYLARGKRIEAGGFLMQSSRFKTT